MKLAKLLFDVLHYTHEKVSTKPEKFMGLDEYINTGHVDAQTSQPCPPIESKNPPTE